jgi:hypothetical protein
LGDGHGEGLELLLKKPGCDAAAHSAAVGTGMEVKLLEYKCEQETQLNVHTLKGYDVYSKTTKLTKLLK